MQQNNTDKNSLQNAQVKLEKLKLENKHLTEKLEILKENNKIQIDLLKKQMEDDQLGFLTTKQNLLYEIQTAQSQNIKHIKKEKKYKYQIKLYEDQIADFNSRVNAM